MNLHPCRRAVLGVLFLALLPVVALSAMPPGADSGPAPTGRSSGEYPVPLTSPAVFLYDSGTPNTDPLQPYWWSNYYESPTNFDQLARAFTVAPGSAATTFRIWWAYGAEGNTGVCFNEGGTAGDFSSIKLDLYADAAGVPGAFLGTLDGTWATLDAPTHYREYTLTTPYVFTAGAYHVALRPETTFDEYQKTILWLGDAPYGPEVDYALFENACYGSSGGWYDVSADYGYNPSHGLQVVGYTSANVLDPVPAVDCISSINPCVSVDFELTRFEATPMRGYSVTFTLSPELELCAGLSSVTEGTYLSGAGSTQYFVVDNGGGSYTADCAILGLPCGAVGDGVLFSIDVTGSGGDGTGTITITSITTRDCDNGPIDTGAGPAVDVEVDNTAPGAVTGLSSAQVKTGNDSDGTTLVTVSLTAPADPDLAGLEVYRAPYGVGDVVGAYPEYDDEPGAAPPAAPAYPPAAPWVLTAVTASGQDDDPPNRGQWYYVAFAIDDCGNVSTGSGVSAGSRNYHLGDVSDGVTPGDGDNLVDVADISLLGANYGILLGFPDALAYLDVGPTDDFSVDGLPDTDDKVDFEDLILYAINYGQVSAPRTPPALAGEAPFLQPAVALDVVREAGTTVARLSLVDNADRVKGIHAFLALDGLQVVGIEAGGLVGSQGAPVFLDTIEESGGIWVDLAALGREAVFEGSGVFAVVQLAGDGSAHLGEVVLRDRRNRPASRRPVDADPPPAGPATSIEATGLPSRVELAGARPNPFGASTEILFRLPAAAPVSLTVHDVRGRLVRTLVDRTVGAGEMAVRWDGRANDGRLTGAGIYFYTFRSSGHQETRKLLRVH